MKPVHASLAYLLSRPQGLGLDERRGLHFDGQPIGVGPGSLAEGPGRAGDVHQLHVLGAAEEGITRCDERRATDMILDETPKTRGWVVRWSGD